MEHLGIIYPLGSAGLNGKSQYMDVSENSGTPKWKVYNGKPY